MSKSMINKLHLTDLKIIDHLDPNRPFINKLKHDGHYELWGKIKNISTDDEWWYTDISVRVQPVEPQNDIHLYNDENFTILTEQVNVVPNFDLKCNESNEFWIHFIYTGVPNVSIKKVKFKIGVYAFEKKISRTWPDITPPI